MTANGSSMTSEPEISTGTSDASTTRDYTADQILAAISAAMKAHDMPAVAALIRVLAVKEPRTAEIMLDAIHLAAS